MRRILLLNLALLLCLFQQVQAQSRTVTGQVTAAADGSPLPGVTVILKNNTSIGATTDIDGRYALTIPGGGGTLVFSLVGSETREVPVGNQSTIDVALGQAATGLSEVVVVGYSTATKESFTGTAKVVSGEALERKNVSNVTQALAGEVAGVRVINTSGQPGTVATIRIRGLGSVNGNRDPLYVVDGVPFTGGLNSINPADIESTTVLKDAAATAIYGSRGANGVVLITTKSGRGQKSYIEADVNIGRNMDLLPRYDVITSPEQYIGLAWEGLYNQGVGVGNANPTNYANTRLFHSRFGVNPSYNLWNATAAELIDPTTRSVRPGVTRKYDPENWGDYAFQSSGRQEVNLKFGGSSGKTSYYSSFGYLNDKGYAINSDFDRLSARLNLNQEVNSWITAGLNFNFARTETNNNGQTEDSGSIFWFVDNMPPIFPLFLRDANGAYVEEPIFGGNRFDYGTGRGFGGLTNSIGDATYDVNRSHRNELNGNATLNFNLFEGLTFENRLGAQYFHNKFIGRRNKFYGFGSSSNGRLTNTRTEMFSYNLLNLLRYTKTFGDHSIEALAAHEVTDWSQDVLSASGFNLVHHDNLNLSNAVVSNPNVGYANEYTLESYFGQINYDFNNKYFLSGTIRRDGSSRFVQDKWGTFGSVGAAWLVSSEEFMANQSLLSSLKLKASYGLMGDQAGVGYFPGYDVFDVHNLNDQPAFSFATKGNPKLTWETSKMFQTGIEFEIGNFLTGSVDYYIKNTDNLIFERRVGPSLGYALLLVNDGKLRNNGLEFDLTGNFIQKEDFRLGLNVNGEIFNNKITAMPFEEAKGKQKPIDVQAPYGWSVGHSIFDFYMRDFAGVDPADGRSTWHAYYIDLNGDGKPEPGVIEGGQGGEYVSNLVAYLADNPEQAGNLIATTTKDYADATQQYIGKSAIPDVRGAVNLFGGFKGLELNVQMLYSFGGYAYDETYAGLMGNGIAGNNNWHTDILNRWQSADNSGNGSVPRVSNAFDPNVNSMSSRFVTKANYLVLNNIRLGYAIPSSFTNRFGVGGLSVWVSGDNLWIKTARKGFNPSTAEAGSSSTYRYSPLSTVSAGLRIRI